MLKSDIKILIVEDDPSLGPAIKEALSRSGYDVKLVSNPNDARAASKISEFRAIIVDCMLPQTNGVDLALELKKEAPVTPEILLTSGIFKDRAFVRDSLRKVGTKTFLPKPFDIQQLVSTIDQLFEDDLDTEREPLFQLMASANAGNGDIAKALKSTDGVHAFDLPWIYSLLVQSNLQGELNIISGNGDLAVVAFKDGKIHSIKSKDTESYFGVLLVEKGFTSPEEVEHGLSLDNEKPIGQRLVDINSLSPHAIRVVQMEQMAIRLSKTIHDTSVQANFIEKEIRESDAHIELSNFTPFLSDWITAKITFDWLKTFYFTWLEHPIYQGPAYDRLRLMKSLPLISRIESAIVSFSGGQTIQAILDQYGEQEEEILKGLHFLITSRVFVFSPRKKSEASTEARIRQLRKMAKDMASKNFFEILGVSQNAGFKQISRAYVDLAKALHPDKLEPDAPAPVRELTAEIFSRVTEAHNTLSEEGRRTAYKKKLKHGEAEQVLAAEGQFESARNLLSRGKYQQAAEVFYELSKMKSHRSDIMVFLVWALLKRGSSSRKKTEFLEKISSSMSLIPPEDRHSANYFFVKGLYAKARGNTQKAAKYLKHALAIDTHFLEAKRELTALAQAHRRHKNQSKTFTGDITSVVGDWFKRKK